MTHERGRNEHIICEEILDTQTMKTQTEKLKLLVKQITKFSKDNLKTSKEIKDDPFKKGYFKGWADAYELTAEWIQENIDNELKDNEIQHA